MEESRYRFFALRTKTEPTDHEFGTRQLTGSPRQPCHIPFSQGGAGHSSHRKKKWSRLLLSEIHPQVPNTREQNVTPHSRIFSFFRQAKQQPHRTLVIVGASGILISCQTLVWASFSTQKSCVRCFWDLIGIFVVQQT